LYRFAETVAETSLLTTMYRWLCSESIWSTFARSSSCTCRSTVRCSLTVTSAVEFGEPSKGRGAEGAGRAAVVFAGFADFGDAFAAGAPPGLAAPPEEL